MGTSGTVRLSAVWRMLSICAPGYTAEQKEHHWWVRFEGRVYTALPLGAHGRRHDAEVGRVHVRRMARFLGILACAESAIEAL